MPSLIEVDLGRVRISTLHNETEIFCPFSSTCYRSIILTLVTYSHLPKQLMTGKISLRTYNGQVGEVMAYVGAINKLNTLGLPVRKPRV